MDNWPRIPGQASGSHKARSGPTLPPPGTVVMASVEEDLGDGMYALKWAGNRIAVSSRAVLSTGQSLILKSELSPEGKPTLVVQGPALPEPGMLTGRVVYGPGKRNESKHVDQAGERNQAAGAQQEQSAVGRDLAAGTGKPLTLQAGQSVQSLLGLVLEPLEDFSIGAEELLAAAEEELEARLKKREEEKKAGKGGEEEKADNAADEDGEEGDGVDSRVAVRDRETPARQARPAGMARTGEKPDAAQPSPGSGDKPVEPPANAGAGIAKPESPASVPATRPAPSIPQSGGERQPRPADTARPEPGAGTRPPQDSQPAQPTLPSTDSNALQTRPAAPSPLPEMSPDGRPIPVVPDGAPPERPAPPNAEKPSPIIPEQAQQPPSEKPVDQEPPASPEQRPAQSAQAKPVGPPTSSEAPPVASPENSVPRYASETPPPSAETQQGGRPATNAAEGVPSLPPASGESSQQADSGNAGRVDSQTRTPEASPPRETRPAPESSQPPPRPEALPIDEQAQPATPAPTEQRDGGAARPAMDATVVTDDRTRVPEIPATREPGLPSDVLNAPASETREKMPDAPIQPEQRPEAFIKEALTQLVKAAELPLASSNAESTTVGSVGRLPEAVADKAADILLRAAGLTPDPATMEAAKALIANGVPVDRQSVQALIALAANTEADDVAAVMKAAARLSAKDIPLAAPLVSGLAEVLDRKAGVYELMDKAVSVLDIEPEVREAKPLMDAAKRLLDMLHVDLDGADAASALERYVSTFGRETLGKALALVEKSAQAVLENHATLPVIDKALNSILTLLGKSMSEAEELVAAPPPDVPAPGARPAPVRNPGGEVPPPPASGNIAKPPAVAPEGASDLKGGEAEVPAPAEPEDAPPPASGEKAVPLPPGFAAIKAYMRTLKPFPGLEALNLPPMPKVARLPAPGVEQPAPPADPEPSGSVAEGATVQTETEQPSEGEVKTRPAPPQAPAAQQTPQQDVAQPVTRPATPTQAPPPLPSSPAAQSDQSEAGQPERPEQSVLNKLGGLYQMPGINKPEIELLRPSGFLDRFLSRTSDEKDKAEAGNLQRRLLSGDPEKVEQTLRELNKKEPAVLRELALRLTRMESEIVRSDSLLGRLSDAANTLRDLGRQLLAVKAENLAGQDRNPGVMLAEVPFKLNHDGGDGRMQMFYRKSKGKQEGWTSRVILDLNTTGMGPVLGDMRFFGGDMILNMFVEKPETAEFLERSADELAANLKTKGFRAKSRFMVLPPPPSPPEITAERPDMAEEADTYDGQPGMYTPGRSTTRRRRLDIKG